MGPQREFYRIYLPVVILGSTLSLPAVSQAMTFNLVSNHVKKSASFAGKWRLNRSESENNVNGDTTKKDTPSYFEKQEPLIKNGRIPFYGVWADYFSAYLNIKSDSTFTFSWGFNGKSCWTAGKWERKKDSFYFRADSAYKRLQDQNDCPLPDKLCYYKNKFYRLDGSGNLITGKIPSPYMGKRSPLFKTSYFREKRFNLDYFDSSYYQRATKNEFRVGAGINNVLQPVIGYPPVYSFGFVFSPRYIFAKKKNAYLSLGMPLTFGFSGTGDSTNTEPTLGLMLDLPLIFNYNYAFGSLQQGGSRFGYFAGGGIAYHYNKYSISSDPAIAVQQVNGFGPVVNAGIRYSLGKYRIRDFELRFSYMKMIVESKTDVFGIGLLVNF